MSDPINLSDPNGDCPVCAALAIGCVVGGAIGVGTGAGLAALFGRKYSLGDGLRDFGVGCVTGALTEGIGSALSRGAAAGEELTGTASYRTPDILNHAAQEIGEVKNVAYQSLTSQLRDDIAYAQANGYTFNLYVRGSTEISGPLQTAANNGLVNIIRSLP
jgi:hypothetical protein